MIMSNHGDILHIFDMHAEVFSDVYFVCPAKNVMTVLDAKY